MVSWSFLLRVQSECIPLEAGRAEDSTCLAPQRHSGLWVDQAGALNLRLQRRKHRPQGSHLRRACSCAQGPAFCVPHCVRRLLQSKQPGEKLWAFTAAAMLKELRRLLGMLSVPGAPEFTLKAFRAGHATALAAAGHSLAAVMAAGEWRSMAALRYIDTDAVDQAQLLATTIEAFDDDEVEPAS